jgi:hypothetical protein
VVDVSQHRTVASGQPCSIAAYCFGHIHEAYGATVVTWKDNEKIGADAIENQTTTPNA